MSWGSINTGLQNVADPIPLSLSIPANYIQTLPGGPLLVDSSTVSFQLRPPLIIPAGCGCDLVEASFCFSQPNVGASGELASFGEGNDRITIQFGANPSADFIIPTGLYSVDDVEFALNQIAAQQGWVNPGQSLFSLVGVAATQQILFGLNPAAITGNAFPAGGITVSFQNPGVNALNNSMGELLGFPTNPADPNYVVITAPGGGTTTVTQLSPNPADFATISSYNLYLSILTNSYVNGVQGKLLFSFPLGNEVPNSVVEKLPPKRFPVPTITNSYSNIDVWTTDDQGRRLKWQYYQAPFSFSCLISKNKHDGSV